MLYGETPERRIAPLGDLGLGLGFRAEIDGEGLHKVYLRLSTPTVCFESQLGIGLGLEAALKSALERLTDSVAKASWFGVDGPEGAEREKVTSG